jgi:Fur family peroxide stress response transcriptional regulator
MSTSTTPEPIDLLHEHDLKATTQRVALLDIVMEQGHHPTAEQIHERLTEEHPTVSRSTVYESLSKFVELGILNELHIGDGVTRYEFFNDPHVNVVCRECKQIVDVDSPELVELLDRVHDETAYEVRTQRMELHGVCPDCDG